MGSCEPSAPPLDNAGVRVDWVEWANRLKRLRMMKYENRIKDRSVSNFDAGWLCRCAIADGAVCNGACLQMEVREEDYVNFESRCAKDMEVDEKVKKQAQEEEVTCQAYAAGRHKLAQMHYYSSSESSSARISPQRNMLVRRNAYRGQEVDGEWDRAAWPGDGCSDDDDDSSSCSEEHASSKEMWVVEPERAMWRMQSDSMHKVCAESKRAHSVSGTYADKDRLHAQRRVVKRQDSSDSYQDIIFECGSTSTWAGASCEPRGSLAEANGKIAYSASTADVAVMRARAVWNSARSARRKCKLRVKSKLVLQVLADMTVPRIQ